MGEAMLYGQSKGGGGGSAINGVTESYEVYAGETITAGDFVKFIKEEVTVDKASEDIELFSSLNYKTASNIKYLKLDDYIYVIFHRNRINSSYPYHLAYTVLSTENNNLKILYKAVKLVDMNNYEDERGYGCVLTKSGKILINHVGYNSYAYLSLVEINNDYSLKLVKDELIISNSSLYNYYDIIEVSENVFLFASGTGSGAGYMKFVRLDGTDFILDGSQATTSSYYFNSYFLHRLNDTEALLVNTNNTGSLFGRVLKRDNISISNKKTQSTINNASNGLTLGQNICGLFKLSSGNFLVFLSYTSDTLGACVISVLDDGSVTLVGEIKQISTETTKIGKVLYLGNNKYFLSAGGESSKLKGMFITHDGTDSLENITRSSIIGILDDAYSGDEFRPILTDNGNILIAHNGDVTQAKGRILNAILLKPDLTNNTFYSTLETKETINFVALATETTFDGVAQEDGNASDIIAIHTTEDKSEKDNITKTYTVREGQTINSGDFVRLVDTKVEGAYTSTLQSIYRTTANRNTSRSVESIMLDDGKILSIHTVENDLYMMYSIFKIKEDCTLENVSNGKLDSKEYSGFYPRILPLEAKNHFIVVHASDSEDGTLYYTLCAKIIKIVDNRVETISESVLVNESYCAPYDLSICHVGGTRYAIFHDGDGTNNPYLYCTLISIDDSYNINFINKTLLFEEYMIGESFSVVKLSDNKIFISCQKGSSRVLGGMIVNINDTTVTANVSNIIDERYSGRYNDSVLLPNGNILTLHSFNVDGTNSLEGNLYATVTKINDDDTFTVISQLCVGDGASDGIGRAFINKLENGHYAIIQTRNSDNLTHALIEINEESQIMVLDKLKDLYEGNPEGAKYLGYGFSSVVKGEKVIMFVDDDNYNLSTITLEENSRNELTTSLSAVKKQATRTVFSPYDGVAEESGVEGDNILVSTPTLRTSVIETNHNLVECYSKEFIKEGDFVNISEEITNPSEPAIEIEDAYSENYTFKVHRVDDNNFFAIYIENKSLRIKTMTYLKEEGTFEASGFSRIGDDNFGTSYLDSCMIKEEDDKKYYLAFSNKNDTKYPAIQLVGLRGTTNVMNPLLGMLIDEVSYAVNQVCVKTTEGKALLFFSDLNSETSHMLIVTLNDDNASFTIGSIVQTPHYQEDTSITQIDDFRYCMSYRNRNDYKGYAVIVTVDENDAITFGEPFVFNSSVTGCNYLALHDENTIVCAYENFTDDNIHCTSLSLNGSTITKINDIIPYKEFSSFATINNLSISKINDNNFLLLSGASDTGSTYKGRAVIVTIGSNGNLSSGSSLTYTSSSTFCQCGFLIEKNEIVSFHVRSGYIYIKTFGYNGSNALSSTIPLPTSVKKMITKATSTPFDGIAKTSGIGNEAIFVYTIK